MIAIILEYIFFGYEYLIVASTVALGIGAFWFAVSITKEFQGVLQRSINDNVQVDAVQKSELKVFISEFIDAHVLLKQLSFGIWVEIILNGVTD